MCLSGLSACMLACQKRALCYISEGKGLTNGSVTALRRKVPTTKVVQLWRETYHDSGDQRIHKVILHNKHHTRDSLGGKNPGGWLSLLGQEAAEKWAEDRDVYRISWGGDSGVF